MSRLQQTGLGAPRSVAWLLVAAVAGCNGGTAVVGSNATTPKAPAVDSGTKLTQLTGTAALEPGQVHVQVIDQTGTGLRIKTLPGNWTGANLRLANGALTADRVVSIPASSFTANSGLCGVGNTATACQTSSAVFTKLRPATYLLQVSVEDNTASPTTILADQSVTVPVVGGQTTNVIITLRLVNHTVAITATNTGNDTGLYTGLLNNSTAHGADFALVQGDVDNILSPVSSGDQAANSQNPSPSVSPGGTNGTATSANGQISRIVASIRAGSSTTVTTSTPQNNEMIVAVWYENVGLEAKTNKNWATFYGSGVACGSLPMSWDTGPQASPAVCDASPVQVVSGLTNQLSLTIPGSAAAASGPNSAGVPGLTLNTTEAGTSADINAVMIFRYYDNTFEHRYAGFTTKTLVMDKPGGISLTIN